MPVDGKTVGRTYVRVQPDSSGFRAEVKRDLDAATSDLKVKVGVDLDTTALKQRLEAALKRMRTTIRVTVVLDTARARAQLALLTRNRTVRIRTTVEGSAGLTGASSALSGISGANFGGVSSGLAGITSGLGGIVANAGKAAAMLGGVSLAVGNIAILGTGAVQAVAQLSGVLGLLPALGLAGGAVLATLAIGFTGLKDAGGAAGEVRDAVKGMSDGFKELRSTIQDNLFQTLAEPIRQLGSTYLPILKTGLAGIADEANTAGRALIAVLQTDQSQADTATGLANTREFMRGITEAAPALVTALRDISVVGSSFLPALGEGLGNAAQRFADFIAQARGSGQLQEWIQGGIDGFKTLWEIVKNVGSILEGIFHAAGMEDFLRTLETVTQKFEELVNNRVFRRV